MRHMGKSGRTAIGASLAALALLVLTGATLNETVGLWFLPPAPWPTWRAWLRW